MSNENIRVCLLSLDSGLPQAIARTLGGGFATRTSNELLFERLAEIREWCDVILLDLLSSGMKGDPQTGLALIAEMNQIPGNPPVVVLCDGENRTLLLAAMERGAYDSVANPPNMVELRLVLKRAHKFHAAENELERLRSEARGKGRLHELLGTAPAIQELFALAQKIAPCDVSVLITGETGTGKELLARAIHHMSARNGRAIVGFSCANLPETLIEDELFGHEKGAFTGALLARQGRLEAANQGTLFLDEIGDISIGLQPKLLRVLQERSFERLGGNAKINIDIRLICATNRNLGEMVRQGQFREDLYYRLNVVNLHLPPLRERRDDVPLLAQHFLEHSVQQFKKKPKRFSQAAMHALEEYGWPGNVRELENAVQRAVVLSEGHTVDVAHLPVAMRTECETPQVSGTYEEEVRQFKRRLVLRTLRDGGWRKAECARTLGVARGYLHRLINQLEIHEPEENSAAQPARPFPSSDRIM